MSDDVEKRSKRKRRSVGRRIKRDDLKKGIYVLPNLLTTMALVSGFFSIISSISGHYIHAVWAIFVSVFFDSMDGKVARLTHTESEFGVQYDSLADLISFGVAPGILMYQWALTPYERLGWLGAALYVICAALRLARFNVQVSTVDKKYFLGIPSPGAALVNASTVLFMINMDISVEYWRFFLLLLMYSTGLLMVSNIKYFSFKDLDASQRRPVNVLVLIILVAILIASKPEIMLFTVFSMYALSGPLGYLYMVLTGRSKELEELEAEEQIG